MRETHTSRSVMLAMATLLFSGMGKADLEKRHVQLVTPTPFEWAEYGPTNPLRTDGSDYPCKIPHGDQFSINGTATEIASGEEQTVSFSGWSVHGGGSCQFALTEGHSPTPDSAWKVIQSIEGGCPKANVAGNLEPGQNPDTYNFTIPDDFQPGDYTWAWTWVNKIAGEPEFYMNCAPISVTTTAAAAGSTKRGKARREKYHRRAASYPDLFLANIGSASNGCTTSEAVKQQIAIAYPHPGSSVSHPNGQDNLFPQACDGNSRNSGALASGGSQSSSSSAMGSAAAGGGGGGATMSILPASTALGSSAPSSTLSATSSAGALSSGPAAAAASSSSSSYSSSNTLSDPAPSSTPTTMATSVTASAAASTGSSILGSSCTDGHLLCVGGTQFSTCTGGVWNAPQDLAAHTTCEDGEGVGLTIVNHF